MTESFEADYRALTAERGIVPLAGWSTLRVCGDDRLTFLNNFATNDVKSLPVGGGCETFFCDVKGKIVAHGVVLVIEDAALVVGVPGTSERLLPHLDRYVIREKVELADQSDSRAWSLLAGQGVRSDGGPALYGAWAHRIADAGELSSNLARLVACPWPWSGGILVEHQPAATEKIAAWFGARLCEGYALESLRLESGWPLFGVDFDGSNLPQEVDRDAQSINFKKGCYLGQETVARIDALGHVNKKLALVKFAADLLGEVPANVAPGAPLFADENQQAGVLTSVAWSPRFNAPIALAMLRRGCGELGSRVACGTTPGEVTTPIAPT